MERVRSMQLSRRNRHREEEWQHVLELSLSSTSYAKNLMEFSRCLLNVVNGDFFCNFQTLLKSQTEWLGRSPASQFVKVYFIVQKNQVDENYC